MRFCSENNRDSFEILGKMKKQTVYVIDAFTGNPFSGNQAAVCVYRKADKFTDAQMQRIAAEMNLSETCFVFPLDAAAGLFSLRWFTPTVEVPLCGHGTLAAAFVLFQRQKRAPKSQARLKELRFKTLKGELVVRKDPSRKDHLLMDFPAGNPIEVGVQPASLLDALSRALNVPSDTMTELRMCNVTRKLLVVVSSPNAVLNARPDGAAIQAIEFPKDWTVKGVIVSAKSSDGEGFDFVSRYFAPFLGILEDPVTGSAHCALAPYWCARLGKARLTGMQVACKKKERKGKYLENKKKKGERKRRFGGSRASWRSSGVGRSSCRSSQRQNEMLNTASFIWTTECLWKIFRERTGAKFLC
jgi:PhzF family phenazine biosynthesis protein